MTTPYYQYDEGPLTFAVEDPPLGRTTTDHQRQWMREVSAMDWLIHINTQDWGGMGYYADGEPSESSEEELTQRRVKLPYVTDFGWLTFLNDTGGGYSGVGGYEVQEHGNYGTSGYAWLPNEASGGMEGIKQFLNRMPGILSVGYEYAVQGMLTAPDQLYGYSGTLPQTFQPQIQIQVPWLQPSVP